jgi:hypothetical protein
MMAVFVAVGVVGGWTRRTIVPMALLRIAERVAGINLELVVSNSPSPYSAGPRTDD